MNDRIIKMASFVKSSKNRQKVVFSLDGVKGKNLFFIIFS